MGRTKRIVLPGMPHHITQRGNNGQDIFFTDDDRETYLRLLRIHSKKYGLRVEGYCLMTNHVHLIVTPRDDESLAKAVGRTHYAYTTYINELHDRIGHLWHNRFYSCPMDNAHYLAAMRYVERNPVRARMARLPWKYKWSSAAAHIGDAPPPEFLDTRRWARLDKRLDWKEFVEVKDSEMDATLRSSTHRGRPLANDKLLAKLEVKLNRRLRTRPLGRPKND